MMRRRRGSRGRRSRRRWRRRGGSRRRRRRRKGLSFRVICFVLFRSLYTAVLIRRVTLIDS
jgi:hypothetical protein